MRPKTLKKSTDYRPALLWLMGQLSSAPRLKVHQEFLNELGDLIPPKHHGMIESGYIRWKHNLDFARTELAQNGYMSSSAGVGIWTITDAGKKWLKENPDLDKSKLNIGIKEDPPEDDDDLTDTQKRVKAHQLLDNQIQQINNFLDKKAAQRPTDEELCDWVCFCHKFKFFSEGVSIFKKIDSGKIEPFYYRRIKKLMNICQSKISMNNPCE
jgi:hypothetical protein